MALWNEKGTAGAADTGVHPVDESCRPGRWWPTACSTC